jgi:hypothetical protein
MPKTVAASTLNPVPIHTAVDLRWMVAERKAGVCAVLHITSRGRLSSSDHGRQQFAGKDV